MKEEYSSLKDLRSMKDEFKDREIAHAKQMHMRAIGGLYQELVEKTMNISLDNPLIWYKNSTRKLPDQKEFTSRHLIVPNIVLQSYHTLDILASFLPEDDLQIVVNGALYEVRTQKSNNNYSIAQRVSPAGGVSAEKEFDDGKPGDDARLYGLPYQGPFIVLNAGFNRFLEIFRDISAEEAQNLIDKIKILDDIKRLENIKPEDIERKALDRFYR